MDSPVWVVAELAATPTEVVARAEPQRMSDETWRLLDEASGKTIPRGKVITLDEFRSM